MSSDRDQLLYSADALLRLIGGDRGVIEVTITSEDKTRRVYVIGRAHCQLHPAIRTLMIAPSPAPDWLWLSPLEEAIIAILGTTTGFLTRPEIVDRLRPQESATGRIRGILSNLVERKILEVAVDPRRGYRLCLAGVLPMVLPASAAVTRSNQDSRK